MATGEAEVPVKLSLGPFDDGRPVTDEEFAEAHYEEPWRYELVDGKLVVMSPNSEEHDDATEVWRDYFVAHKLAHSDRIQKVVSEAWVKVAPRRQRIGDVGIFLRGARSSRRRPSRPPEIMIEVVSPGLDSHDRDHVQKRAEYHAIELLEYIIVDDLIGRVLVLHHESDGYIERVLTESDGYTTPLLPGLAIPIAEVLGES